MKDIIQRYFDAFNRGDVPAMLDCLSDDVAHHVNEGQVRQGKEKFRAFCEHMNRCYREELIEMVIFSAQDGTRAAAEFIVTGTYLQTDEGLPEARGQTYKLPAGSFFSLRDGRITRVVTYYNLAEWMRQVA
ncbi:ketosteroid isomerase-related protein [Roseovarius aestuarii]|uniref:SnoaL-like domain protein n=1 Tax=Roseovarius aestuarii TaxID=475083 RepID=A0A1X7BVM4_9RHOB|nr:ketosteroid isomerase-related protein [Roseovarius aestuarii]SMC13696.1 SnoaL-like domain protein [Roseovarius aestuarii]